MSRHLSPLLLALLLVVVAACDKKKDPEPDKPEADPVEGWWKVEVTAQGFALKLLLFVFTHTLAELGA